MIKNRPAQSGIFDPHYLLSVYLCLSGVFLAALSFAATPSVTAESSSKKSHSIASKHAQRALAVGMMSSASTNAPSGTGWSIVTSPNTWALTDNILSAVACASALDCWAVGFGFDGSKNGLIEHWNGNSWAIVSSPKANGNEWLLGVTCLSTSNCWAVGINGGTGVSNAQTLIKHWDGTSWILVPSPNASATHDNLLSSVACASASDCWAVGYYSNESLIERWDGTSWTIIPSPNNSVLTNVTCVSQSECWAVGYYYSERGTPQTLIERWDGSDWTIVTSPNSSSMQINELQGVTCVSASDCWAVGYHDNGSYYQTLIEQWDGNSWTIIPSPSTSATQSNRLQSVTCTSTSRCRTVGYYYNSNSDRNVYQTLIEQWDGVSWTIATSPAVDATQSNGLMGATCVSESQCWAVGYNNGGNFYTDGTRVAQTLIEEYSPTVPALTSVASRMTHGGAGTFDVDLPIVGKRGVECRSGGPNGNYSVVFTFVNDVTDCGRAGTTGGTIVPGPSTNQCTENITGVPNVQYINLELDNVVDSQNNTGNVAVPMGVLIGDTNADGFVDAIDVSQTKSQSGNAVKGLNFREDINLDGFVDAIDTSFVKSKSGTALPSLP